MLIRRSIRRCLREAMEHSVYWLHNRLHTASRVPTSGFSKEGMHGTTIFDSPRSSGQRLAGLVRVRAYPCAVCCRLQASHFFSKVPWLFLLVWVSLRWRELGWRDVGLAGPANWPRAITIGVLCGIGMELLELFVTQSVLVKVFHKIPDFSELGDLQDNWELALLFIALALILGAFGEEMVYRGYLMNRVAGLFRKPEFVLGPQPWLRELSIRTCSYRSGDHWPG